MTTIDLPSTARNLTPAGLIAVAWIGFGLAAALVTVGCYARFMEFHRLSMDDYWLLVALTFLAVNAILQTLQTPSSYFLTWLGAGRASPEDEILQQGNTYVRYEFVVIGFFWTVVWSVKASFLSMYWRLFHGLPQYKRMWWAVAIFTPLAYVGCWIASVWTCHPPSAYFHFGHCTKSIDMRGGTISISYSTAVDVLTDLLIMFLPIRLLPRLQISARQKVGLAGIFCSGFIIIGTSLVRLSQILGSNRTDPIGLAVWGLVESSTAVMVGSLPALKTLIGRRFQSSSDKAYSNRRRIESIPPVDAFSETGANPSTIPLEERPYPVTRPSDTRSARSPMREREYC